MCTFCNPGVLGTPNEFRRQYEAPIVAGREPDATDAAALLGTYCDSHHAASMEEPVAAPVHNMLHFLGQERSAELSKTVNEFILRRTNTLLSQHLPPKARGHTQTPCTLYTVGVT